jgi:hypothetical protein
VSRGIAGILLAYMGVILCVILSTDLLEGRRRARKTRSALLSKISRFLAEGAAREPLARLSSCGSATPLPRKSRCVDALSMLCRCRGCLIDA